MNGAGKSGFQLWPEPYADKSYTSPFWQGFSTTPEWAKYLQGFFNLKFFHCPAHRGWGVDISPAPEAQAQVGLPCLVLAEGVQLNTALKAHLASLDLHCSRGELCTWEVRAREQCGAKHAWQHFQLNKCTSGNSHAHMPVALSVTTALCLTVSLAWDNRDVVLPHNRWSNFVFRRQFDP